MDDLITFLRARLDELQVMIDNPSVPGAAQTTVAGSGVMFTYWHKDTAGADVDAKREIVRLYQQAEDKTDIPDGRPPLTPEEWRTLEAWEKAVNVLEVCVQRLALPYADHADYREEWRP